MTDPRLGKPRIETADVGQDEQWLSRNVQVGGSSPLVGSPQSA
jgi:hypothetical protein